MMSEPIDEMIELPNRDMGEGCRKEEADAMAGLSDTHPEAEQVLREAYRKMPFATKWRQMEVLYHTARRLHAAGVRYRNPSATPEMIEDEWRIATLGREFAQRRCGTERNMEYIEIVQKIIAVLSHLDIPYALGGSWASSLLGKMRFTHDADLTVEPFPGKEAAFCAAFGEDYYVSLPMIQDAIRRRSSFNVIHWPSSFKVDLFIRKDRPFEAAVLARRRPHQLPEGQEVMLVSPEDIILLKLEWYRLGGGASERQWQDILGVLQVQADRLDQTYLDHWAADLGVADLLQRARQESAV
jgi:hypothetical protein